MLGGRKAFINFPESLLLDDTALLLPPGEIVVEILETVEVNERMIEACKRLRARHFAIALDDFVDLPDGGHPFIEFADYIKVDFRSTNREECARIAERYSKQTTLLAEKLETEEDFRWAMDHGYRHFQGYFFAKPHIRSVPHFSGFRQNFLDILKNLNESEIDFAKLAAVVEREPGLSYKLLRMANSAMLSRRQSVTSVFQALCRVGEQEVRRWLALMVMLDLCSERPNELMVSALIRARFCESLGEELGLSSRASELFLMGLFSRLDTLFNQPLEQLISELNFPKDLSEMLLNPNVPPSPISHLWELVLAYEAGEWGVVSEKLPQSGLQAEAVRKAYIEAVAWSDSVFSPSAAR